MPIHALAPWFNLVAVALLSGLALYTWHFRQERGALAQTATMAAKALCILALVLMDRVTELPVRLFWDQVRDAMLQAVPVLAFLLYRDLSREYVKVPRFVAHLVVGTFAISMVCAWTDPLHHLYSAEVSTQGGHLQVSDGPLGRLAFLASYLTMAVGLGVVFLWAKRARGLRRRHALYFGSLLVVGWLGHALGCLVLRPPLSPLPMAWLLTGLVSAWAYQRWRIHTVIPLARQTALETTTNGLLVVDETDHVVDLNGPAQALLEGLDVREGTPFAALQQAWPDLASPSPGTPREVSRLINGRPCTFLLRETPLKTGRHLLGRVFVFREITREKEQQARLLEQERALAALRERDRLGRELHDGPAQIWAFTGMQVETVLTLLAHGRTSEAEEKLKRLLEVTRDVHVDLRESIAGLHVPGTVPGDLVGMLEAQVQWYRHHCGLKAEFVMESPWHPDRLSPEVGLQVQRILLEALANVRKSAQASRLKLTLRQEEACTVFEVTDNGRGFDPKTAFRRPGHHGLAIMVDRAAEIGAHLHVDSQPGMGTTVTLRIDTPQMAVCAPAT